MVEQLVGPPAGVVLLERESPRTHGRQRRPSLEWSGTGGPTCGPAGSSTRAV